MGDREMRDAAQRARTLVINSGIKTQRDDYLIYEAGDWEESIMSSVNYLDAYSIPVPNDIREIYGKAVDKLEARRAHVKRILNRL